MILGETLGTVGIGLVIGAVLASAASRLVESRLFGIAPQDPVTASLATAVLLSVAFVAAYLPARRAARLDPIAALHHQ
jgi:ABC-type antimicrobial peptide transport system permease subunit